MNGLKLLKELVKENEERFQKREQVKAMLEKQVLLGEKRAAEQIRITEAREKLLALKMRELELQKAKLARKKREQEEKERATEDFLAHIDKQLEDMETKAATPQPTGAIPKQKRNKSKGKGRNRSKSNTPKVKSPEPIIQAKAASEKVKSPEPQVETLKVNANESKTKQSDEVKQEEDKKSETEAKVEEMKTIQPEEPNEESTISTSLAQ